MIHVAAAGDIHFGPDAAGTLRPHLEHLGERADLLLLERNPLESVSNLRRRVGVMVDGRWMPEEWLQQRLTGSHGR